MEIVGLYISPAHNYFHHYGRPAGEYPTLEVQSIECVAGHGIQGDRFYDYRDDYKGQITFFALEVFQELCRTLGLHDKSPSAARRNVVTRGVDLKSLIGKEFEVQGVLFYGTEHCRPCSWMNEAFGPGAEEFLKSRGGGGLRARILTSGCLQASADARKPILEEVPNRA